MHPGDEMFESIMARLQAIEEEAKNKYPGSSTERKNYDGEPEDKLPALGEGRKYLVGGRHVEFYSIGQLAAMLNRSAVTVRRWERQGIIPRATFIKSGQDNDDRGKRRLYSRAQIEGMVTAAREEGILDDLSKGIRDTKFTDKVIKIFSELEKK